VIELKILLVEDEKITRISLTETLAEEGHLVTSCATGDEGLDAVNSGMFDLILSDLRLPGASGLEILQRAKERDPECKFIIMTAYASVETAIEALRKGAYDYLSKPFHPDELLSMVNRIGELNRILKENVELKKIIQQDHDKPLVGESDVMLKLFETLDIISKRDYPVLITGESGTGKEMVAREIHRRSERNDKSFLAVNCAVIPENLFESELFGHEKGAFSGAIKQHKGYFERANGGLLFIDDVDDLPLLMQVKLLRVLQEQEFNRVGGSEPVKINVRIVAATKVDLREKVNDKKFREDLFYRLNIIPLRIAPLRERSGDIPLLLNHFFLKYNTELSADKISENQIEEIISYDWPGNVRELENVARRLIALPEMPALNLKNRSAKQEISQVHVSEEKSFPGYNEYMGKIDKEIIKRALKEAHHNISDAARLLKIPRSTLRSKLEKLNLISEDQ